MKIKKLAILVLIVTLGILAVAATFTPQATAVNVQARLEGPSAAHWFGTDELGRDSFWRDFLALRNTALIVSTALALGICIGGSAGLLAAFYGHRLVGKLIEGTFTVVWSFPGLLVYVLLTSFIGRETWVVVLSLGLLSWVPIARVVAAECRRQLVSDYVRSMRSFGLKGHNVIVAVLANARLGILISCYTVWLDLIAAESGLSFLGLGIQPPNSTLGRLISSGVFYGNSAWWLVLFASVLLIAFVLAAHALVEDSLRLSTTAVRQHEAQHAL